MSTALWASFVSNSQGSTTANPKARIEISALKLYVSTYVYLTTNNVEDVGMECQKKWKEAIFACSRNNQNSFSACSVVAMS